VYIDMSANVAKMIASKELSVFIHLPKLGAPPSVAKSLTASANKKKNPVAVGRNKETGMKRKLDENSSKQANKKKPKVIDLADSDSDDVLSVTETVLVPPCAAAAKPTIDILWDEDVSEEEYEFSD
jgi:sulfite reductase alpha subunit-like flavoprotein